MHGFIMQGLDHVYLVHICMFHMANHRWQLIVTADLPPQVLQEYRKLRAQNPDQLYTIANVVPARLDDLLTHDNIEYRMDKGIPAPKSKPLVFFI
ncbi:hypothetical protein CDD81_6501 [Ophiocordyceps australis]|uniref:Uncharacterized protein n=1 Tax=Ophiocordyceps australis TaxID=1399860 RepID=A0A2C5YI49_9HYPO|nr:hypothetical protein CDD81_6501 [Ophiocordyceps australis]